MTPPADLLWRVNNEYQKRLKQTQTYLGLLEQRIAEQDDQAQALAALSQARLHIDRLMREHRDWRHHYYYESVESRRMVHTPSAINQALAQFSRMRTRHERDLTQVRALLERMPRPDPALTRVPTADLWVLAEFAINDLSQFDDYMRSLSYSS